jgi:LysR family transcriptional regulator, glycine cleavage system transcriptional activator
MTGRRPPSTLALRSLDAVIRNGSVRRAGDELGVSHTVISRHIQNLETALGAKLMRRDGRGLVMTDAGVIYHGYVARALDLLDAGRIAVHDTMRRSFDIWCAPGIASRRLMQFVPELTAKSLGLEVSIQPTLARPDLARGQADAEIVFAQELLSDDRLRSEMLVQPRLFPVASPSYVARHPSLCLEDLLKGALIHEETTAHWEQWFAAAGLSGPLVCNGPRLWHAHLTLEAARLGQGVALTNEILAMDDLRSGALVEPIASTIYLGSYQFVALRERWTDPRIVTIRQWAHRALSVPKLHQK